MDAVVADPAALVALPDAADADALAAVAEPDALVADVDASDAFVVAV